jgi:hypothetical protein
MFKKMVLFFLFLLLIGISPIVNPAFAAPKETLIVYYFHTTYRCSSCTLLEQYSKDAVMKNFPEEIKSGRIKFVSLNVEKDPNQHYVKDYQLSFKSVVVSVRDEKGREIRWENLSKVWVYLRDRNALEKYIVERIRTQLKEMPRA